MRFRNGFACMLLAFVGIFGSVSGNAQTTLPTIQVTATTIDGWSVVCSGTACAQVLGNFGIAPKLMMPGMADSGGGGALIPLSHMELCESVQAAKPANCSALNPPPSPRIKVPGQADWAPNGCGSSSTDRAAMWVAASNLAGTLFSGNVDAPYPGVSFRTACDNHDRCYAVQGGKGICDDNFRTAMISVCQGVAGCEGFANTYAGVVQVSDAAAQTYNSLYAERVCALWNDDMRKNSCGPT